MIWFLSSFKVIVHSPLRLRQAQAANRCLSLSKATDWERGAERLLTSPIGRLFFEFPKDGDCQCDTLAEYRRFEYFGIDRVLALVEERFVWLGHLDLILVSN